MGGSRVYLYLQSCGKHYYLISQIIIVKYCMTGKKKWDKEEKNCIILNHSTSHVT